MSLEPELEKDYARAGFSEFVSNRASAAAAVFVQIETRFFLPEGRKVCDWTSIQSL